MLDEEEETLLTESGAPTTRKIQVRLFIQHIDVKYRNICNPAG